MDTVSTSPILVYTAFHLAVLAAYVPLRCHSLRCLEAAEQDEPVQRRFSKHRDKGMALLFICVFPAFFLLHLLLCVPFRMLRSNFGAFAYHRFLGDLSIGSLFMVYPLLYVLWETYNKWRFREEYDDYCASYSVRQMNEWAAWLPDDPIKFHREAVKLNRLLLWVGVILTAVSLVRGSLDLNEYAYFDDTTFHYNAFWSLRETDYGPEDFETIYKADTFVTVVGKEVHEPFYAFALRDGTQILFRPVQASEPFIQRAMEFSGLPITSIPMLRGEN